jgi:hypothetical protein
LIAEGATVRASDPLAISRVHRSIGDLPDGTSCALSSNYGSAEIRAQGCQRKCINSGNPSMSILDADGQGDVGITFGRDGPSLKLEDGSEFSALVGTLQIENPNRQLQRTSAASVVLFDKNKKIIWKAP